MSGRKRKASQLAVDSQEVAPAADVKPPLFAFETLASSYMSEDVELEVLAPAADKLATKKWGELDEATKEQLINRVARFCVLKYW